MTNNQEIYNQLLTIVDKNNIAVDEYLRNHTYTKLGGKADFFITPNTYEEVAGIVQYCKKKLTPLTLIGNGSNLIVRDGGIRGIVLSLKNFHSITADNNTITAQSGAAIIDVSRKALEAHLTGLEFACGIPGTVGGALYMNAGAYGGEVKDVLDHCIVVDKQGKLQTRTASELELSYRHSNIEEKGDIVLEATFQLKPGKFNAIKEMMDDLTYRRESKQPLEYPSCGSVFKRPPGYFAGKLIQDSNLQGTRLGGAEVSKKHAGFIVNVDNATATEYISLIEHVQKTVKEKFNVALEREVRIIGEDL
ncbi:UDP-N-acetylmuramate dehydrogenase [Caldibacillus lycopersici]|uniref:UDP-N-acetylenolpyruvoylglucosamine reductase n=1 Tax=Perspicuibacillus lycopersici TaxID=1325689 RepID=A0AAE3IY65_9BACI|nr:UDP-N-acetylmuramate dehydrogenase [Perspicuibacillus lycopersici]MCU9615104.1 UDP-N-acetylmuramate dehydrogenase [Perspicuibacillus lycopersici]